MICCASWLASAAVARWDLVRTARWSLPDGVAQVLEEYIQERLERMASNDEPRAEHGHQPKNGNGNGYHRRPGR